MLIGHRILRGGYTLYLGGFSCRETARTLLLLGLCYWHVLYRAFSLIWGRTLFLSGRCSIRATKSHFSFPVLLLLYMSGKGVPLFDVDEVLPMDTPIYPLLVRSSFFLRVREGGKVGLALVVRPRVQTVRTPSQVHESR